MKVESGRAQDLADAARMLGLASEDLREQARVVFRRHAPEALEDLETLITLGKREMGRREDASLGSQLYIGGSEDSVSRNPERWLRVSFSGGGMDAPPRAVEHRGKDGWTETDRGTARCENRCKHHLKFSLDRLSTCG
jgi:hypothetical protein